MKRLLALVLIVTLPLIAWFEYTNYRENHPPSVYAYKTAEGVDLNYHDQEVVKKYYQTSVELESIGRYCWKEFQLDVRTDKPADTHSKDLVRQYEAMLAQVKEIEERLLQSKKWKSMDLDNQAIQLMEENDFSPSELKAYTFLKGKKVLDIDEQGEAVFKVQKMLSKLGYELPVDGYYERKTSDAVSSFQKANNLYPTGRVGDLTLKLLMEQTNKQ